MNPVQLPPSDWLRKLAHGLAPDLLEQVIAESRQDAAEILRSALTVALVEEVQCKVVAGGPEQHPEPDRPRELPTRGWYVYGITWASAPLTSTSGICRCPVERVVVGDLAAIATPVAESTPWGLDEAGELDLAALAPRVQEHAQVLEDALERVVAILPLRFGVMYPTLEAVEAAVRTQEEALRRTLRRLENHAQWDIVLGWRGKAPGPHPSLADRREQAAANVAARNYLSHRAEQNTMTQLSGQRARAAAMSVHEELATIASDSILQPVPRGRGRDRGRLLKASYLVPNDRAESFRISADSALLGVDGDLGLTGDLTGPWPPYDFSELLEEKVV